jgi:hypothetical protein
MPTFFFMKEGESLGNGKKLNAINLGMVLDVVGQCVVLQYGSHLPADKSRKRK